MDPMGFEETSMVLYEIDELVVKHEGSISKNHSRSKEARFNEMGGMGIDSERLFQAQGANGCNII